MLQRGDPQESAADVDKVVEVEDDEAVVAVDVVVVVVVVVSAGSLHWHSGDV